MHALKKLALLLIALSAAPYASAADDEKEAGNPAESAYLTRDYIFVDSPQIETYLRSVAQRLLDAGAVKMAVPHVLIYSSDAFDVFTDSERNLILSTGALRRLDNEDELAAVLGHELSHQILKHPQRKDTMRMLPVGLETATTVRAVSRKGSRNAVAYSGKLSRFGEESLASTQAANLVWSDLLAPSWNRKQERAADEKGFTLMRAAGYDPSAFGTLFQKLHDAEAKRSDRMEQLKRVLIARARASDARKKASAKKASETDEIASVMKTALTEKAAESVVSGLSSFNREYDSPDERQAGLARYAREHREKKRAASPTSAFKQTLRQGPGGRLLILDDAGVRVLEALNARNLAGAERAAKPLIASGGKLASPHLNFPLGAWYHARGRAEIGERHARAWLTAKRPPAQAYVWVAYYQANRKEYGRAIETLEKARKRVGNSAPFLPHLVSLAVGAGRKEKAEKYTRECAKEDQKNAAAMVTQFFKGDKVPSGLYADCVNRLGYQPKSEGLAMNKESMTNAVKKPLAAGKNLTNRIRNKFRRD